MTVLKDMIEDQLLFLDGFNSVSFPRRKNTYANNIQCMKKRIARNKNKKR